jgi:hypothetical protein
MTRQVQGKIAHEVPFLTFTGNGNLRARVSLPAPPWGALLRDDRLESKPRTAPVRGDRPWSADPVLRHASTRKDNG